MATAGLDAQPATREMAPTPLRTRLMRRLPLALWLLIVGLAVAEVWLILVTLDRPGIGQWGFRGFEVILAVSFGSVGALIAARRPDNRIGWTALWVSLVTGVQGIVNQYPLYAEAVRPVLAGADMARWIAAWVWAIPSVMFMVFLPLLFPTGRLLSRAWWPAAVFGLVAMAAQVGSVILVSQPLGPVPPTADPTAYFERIGPAMAIGYILQFSAVAVAAVSAIVRYQRATGDERQQMKWLAYVAAVLPFAAAAGFSGNSVGQLLLIASAVLGAAAIAIAILRYRLYEIDVIINRTLVYGALSAILAGVYTASITLSQRLFTAVTGERSDAAIVITTLIVAATFTPLKSRLQAFFDARLKAAQPGPADEPAATPEGLGAAALDLLTRLDAMRSQGILTRAEFESKKADLLSRV